MGVAIGSILGWGIACKILVSGAMPQPDTQNLILMTDLIVVPYLTRHRLHSVALSDPYLNASLYTQRVGHWPHAPTGHHPHPVSLSVLCPNGAGHTSPGCNPGRRGLRVWRSVGTPHIPECLDRAGVMRRSFRTHRFVPGLPRVLPWAGMLRPVGAFNTQNGPIRCGLEGVYEVRIADTGSL